MHCWGPFEGRGIYARGFCTPKANRHTHTCPHTTIYVPSYYFICVLTTIHNYCIRVSDCRHAFWRMCVVCVCGRERESLCVWLWIYASVCLYYYICVHIILCMCPHTTIYVSSYYTCPHTAIYVWGYGWMQSCVCVCVLVLVMCVCVCVCVCVCIGVCGVYASVYIFMHVCLYIII
jgi:hypothetical protein